VKYILEVNEKQAQVVSEAMELYARLGIGQYGELNHMSPPQKPAHAESFFLAVKDLERYVFDETTARPSISGAAEPYRIAYDVYQVVRHRLAWDKEPAGGVQVWYDKPFRVSEEKLPKIKKETT